LGICAAIFLGILGPRIACSQTPSPLQEWQYSGGIILARLFEPNLSEWRVIAGVGAEVQPVYAGAAADRVQGGPAIDIEDRDIAFLSSADGIGVNVFRAGHYPVVAPISSDFG